MKPIATIPVFHVADVDVSASFYTNVLGFVQSFSFGTYRGMKMGSSEIHITLPGDFQPKIGGGTAYVICDEVDSYHATVLGRGAQPLNEPGDRMYGLRDFVVLDPDGNQLTFGKDIEEAEPGGTDNPRDAQ